MLGQLLARVAKLQAHLATSGGTRPVAAFIENCRPQCVSAVAVTRASFECFFSLRTPDSARPPRLASPALRSATPAREV